MRNPMIFVFPGLMLGMVMLVIAATLLTTSNKAAHAATFSQGASVQPTAQKHDSQVSQNKSQVSPEGCHLPLSYPNSIRRWCTLLEQEAKNNGLDARLLAAVMLQESGGNSEAYSKSGAVGLMQVMPRDGLAASFQCINGPCFAARPTIKELLDPAFNIHFGARMLAGLIQKHGGMRAGLKAYGPMDAGYTYADKILAIYSNYQ